MWVAMLIVYVYQARKLRRLLGAALICANHGPLSARQEKVMYLGSRARGANQIALYVRAAKRSSLLLLLRCFDTLGDDPHIESFRHIRDRANDGAGFFSIS